MCIASIVNIKLYTTAAPTAAVSSSAAATAAVQVKHENGVK
jgi:microcystin-dependent protein